MEHIFSALIPVFGLILIGYFFKKIRFPSHEFWPMADKLTYFVLMPSLLIYKLSDAKFDANSIDFVLYDPPYSPRQVSECYKKLGKTVNMQTTQASFWGNLKKEIARITKPDGIVISFGWNTNGIGKTKGFEIIEILTVAHGGQHNDTICTVERKARTLF